MTAVEIRIEEGPDAGKQLYFDESDDLIIGSDRPGCEAHLRLPPDDRYVSRHHCVLEVRPPNCQVRDLGSKNGTEVRRSSELAWRRIESCELSDGDAIRIGRTVLVVRLVSEPASAPDAPIRCIRCLTTIEPVLVSGTFRYHTAEYLCERCQSQVAGAHAGGAGEHLTVVCAGDGCDKDLTLRADRDGRATELADVAFYFCDDCAEKHRGLMRSQVGDWVLLSQVGQGGMGVVYRAWHPESGRVAALKHLLKPLDLPSAKRLRFQREIALLQNLEHPHVTRLFEAGEDHHVPFFVSEFVPDGDLSQFIAPDGRPLLSPEAATQLMADTLLGLQYIHDAGIVHRDMKPENVLVLVVDDALVPKVADFGLSRSYERHGGTITQRGESGGTLAYMAPEQMTDFRRCRPPVDVYSTGVCLYYLLTGHYPIALPTPWKPAKLPRPPVEMVLEDDRMPLRERCDYLSTDLAAVVDAAVQRDPMRRPQNATEFRDRLLDTLPVAS